MKSADFVFIVLKAIAPIITLFASYLSLKLTKWLDTKIKDQELKNMIDKLNVIIPDVVKDIEQSYVQKEKSGAGKLSCEAAVAAKTMAMEKVKQQIGDKGIGEIKEAMNLSDSKANSLIASKIEARVFDLHKIKALAVALVLFLTIGCHGNITPVSSTATIIKSQENVIKAGDESIARWFLGKHEVCIKNGIAIRDNLKKNGSDDEVSKKTGLDVYRKCMENTTELATKIADIIDLIRSKDKVAASIALAVAKGERPVEALGYVLPEIIDLVQKLTKLLREAGVQ